MALGMREPTSMVKRKVPGSIIGLMARSMMECGRTTRLMVMECINRKMAKSIMALGKVETCTASVFISIRMVENTLGSLRMIKKMAMEFIIGMMDVDMRDGGTKENNMD